MTCKAIRFLLVSVLLTFFALFLEGCGGGGTSGPGGGVIPPPSPFTQIEQDEMAAARNVATTSYDAKYISEGPTAAAAAAVAAATGMPGVSASGASEDGKTVWVRFTNGVLYGIAHLPDPGVIPAEGTSVEPLPAPTRDVSQFPNAAGGAIGLCSDVDPAITYLGDCFIPRLSGFGYQPVDNSTYQGNAFNPMTVYTAAKTARVAMLASHGVPLDSAPPDFEAGVGLLTKILYSPENLNAYSTFLRNQDADFFDIYVGEERRYLGCLLVLFPKYVRDWCTFPAGSFVFGNFCLSAAAESDWGPAVLAKGAVAFLGWDGAMAVGAGRATGNGLADLLTGNRNGEITTELMQSITLPPDVSGPEVPLNLGNAKVVLERLDITTRHGNTACLVCQGDARWGLTPHLDKAEVVSDKLVLTGSFGEANGSVWAVPVSEQTPQRLELTTWGATRIVAGLPSADAQVYVKSPGGLESNRLNAWLGSTLMLEVVKHEVTDNGHHFQVLGWAVPAGSERGLVSFQQASDFLVPVAYNTGGVPFMDYLCSYNVGYYDDPNDPNDEWAVNWYLRYPILAGDTWTSRGLSSGMVVSSTVQVVSTSEAVTVPAGTFLCAKVVETMSVPPGYGADSDCVVTRYERWLGSGTGWVKFRVSRSDGKTVVGELVKFSGSGGEPYFFPMALGSQWTLRWRIE